MALRYPTPVELIKIMVIGIILLLPLGFIVSFVIRHQRANVMEKQNEEILFNQEILAEPDIVFEENTGPGN